MGRKPQQRSRPSQDVVHRKLTEQCRQTCNAPSYSWTLHLYSDEVQSQIELLPGYANGSNFYFYVKQSDWAWFKDHYSPLSFGIWHEWNYYELPGSNGDEVIHFTGGPEDPLPVGARNIESYLIAAQDLEAGGYAVAKLLGPWAMGDGLVTSVIPSGPGALCGVPGVNGESDVLRQHFNVDPNVLAHLNGRPLLRCDGMLSVGGGGAWDGGSGDFFCTELTTISETDGDGNTHILDWVEAVTQCRFGNYGLLPAHPVGVKVQQVLPNGKVQLVALPIPFGKDPKLVPVPKTKLDPGLYEFSIAMDNGSIMNHYQSFTSPMVINADFAAFSIINIYPVPVKDNFAVDFDLFAPMDINMTVVDNTGHTYFNKLLQFPLAGRNKTVVTMNPKWPGGLYHAIFQYADGSSEALNFTVSD